jgi:hypothetical protein
MTRKASALALAVLAGLLFATSASAAPTLSLRTAEQLAKRLAIKEIRGRHIVAYHVTNPRRRSAREVVFSYDDRSSGHVYCTARLIVTISNPAKGTLFGRITRPTCRPIPADALAFEAAAARALRQVHARRAAVERSLAAFRRTLRPCSRLRVPRAERARVQLIVSAAGVEALEHPVDAEVAGFVRSLATIRATNATLIAAPPAWADYLASLRALPQVPDACAAVRSWARRGYASPPPVDVAALARLNLRTQLDARAIARTAKLLAFDGVFPQDVVAFTPAGLLLQVRIKALISGIG